MAGFARAYFAHTLGNRLDFPSFEREQRQDSVSLSKLNVP
jgi:hypothetical protein